MLVMMLQNGNKQVSVQGCQNGIKEQIRREGYWTRSPKEWIKCIIDGLFVNTLIESTAGWIFRDENGVFKGAAQAIGKLSYESFRV